MKPEFCNSTRWRSPFRVSPKVFDKLAEKLLLQLTRKITRYCRPFRTELCIVSFSLVAELETCEVAASLLGIGKSTVSSAVHEVSRKIFCNFSNQVGFPKVKEDIFWWWMASIKFPGYHRVLGQSTVLTYRRWCARPSRSMSAEDTKGLLVWFCLLVVLQPGNSPLSMLGVQVSSGTQRFLNSWLYTKICMKASG